MKASAVLNDKDVWAIPPYWEWKNKLFIFEWTMKAGDGAAKNNSRNQSILLICWVNVARCAPSIERDEETNGMKRSLLMNGANGPLAAGRKEPINKPQIKQIHGVEWICDWFVGAVDGEWSSNSFSNRKDNPPSNQSSFSSIQLKEKRRWICLGCFAGELNEYYNSTVVDQWIIKLP